MMLFRNIVVPGRIEQFNGLMFIRSFFFLDIFICPNPILHPQKL